MLATSALFVVEEPWQTRPVRRVLAHAAGGSRVRVHPSPGVSLKGRAKGGRKGGKAPGLVKWLKSGQAQCKGCRLSGTRSGAGFVHVLTAIWCDKLTAAYSQLVQLY